MGSASADTDDTSGGLTNNLNNSNNNNNDLNKSKSDPNEEAGHPFADHDSTSVSFGTDGADAGNAEQDRAPEVGLC